ncbi:hypothetical protein FRZ40_10970 [Paraburkholderia azotifigens]|uniref:DUF6471 domain-containing protein n=2 Tax=Paraburkholderia azotifigens TaxID=2057004 RepID=A0A5C6VX83_9BURK|nr:hypothetical protein FRZ40_10970 [Paraburkholderia azotifigens]
MTMRKPANPFTVDAHWSKLASRAIRVALARRDVSYAQLADALNTMGLSESSRSVEGKIQRGTFRFSFFLQSLAASDNQFPERWSVSLRSGASWEKCAADVIQAELAAQPWLNHILLSHRLAEIGVEIAAETLKGQIVDGTLSTALFLQCATVCRFPDLHFFLDSRDMIDAAVAGALAR